jgi:hypothetical protein
MHLTRKPWLHGCMSAIMDHNVVRTHVQRNVVVEAITSSHDDDDDERQRRIASIVLIITDGAPLIFSSPGFSLVMSQCFIHVPLHTFRYCIRSTYVENPLLDSPLLLSRHLAFARRPALITFLSSSFASPPYR